MPFVVAEFDPGEISFFHHDRAFRRYDPPQTHTTSVHPGLDANLDKVLDVETVRPLVAALPERLQTVLLLRFFENMTQTQIAERLGISQMHVSRLLAQSLATLRQRAQTLAPV